MTDGQHHPAWLRGTLDMCLLSLLEGGDAHGYELGRRLEEHGFDPVPGGSLYPALLRLEKQGYLDAAWGAGHGGPGRKYYSLTPAGRAGLRRWSDEWRAFVDRVDAVLAGVPRS